jgi:hypothetical protein
MYGKVCIGFMLRKSIESKIEDVYPFKFFFFAKIIFRLRAKESSITTREPFPPLLIEICADTQE